jgi:hypothetical protein
MLDTDRLAGLMLVESRCPPRKLWWRALSWFWSDQRLPTEMIWSLGICIAELLGSR